MNELSGIETINEIRSKQNKTLIAFSTGKDAIGAWLSIRDHFDDVIPFYLYLIPKMEFVEESIHYFENFFGKKIVQLPHPSLHRMINNYVFQPPERISVINQANLPNHNYEHIRQAMIKKCDLDKDIFVADGVRSADSPIRRAAITQYGSITYNQHKYHPIHDMKKDELIQLIKKHNCKLPIDYKLFGRSFDGIDLRFLIKIKANFPMDYDKILEWFPLADLEIYRYEHR